MQKSLLINADKCTGCLQCEMACSYENYGVLIPLNRALRYLNFIKPAKRCHTPAPNVMKHGACKLALLTQFEWTWLQALKWFLKILVLGARSVRFLALLELLIMFRIPVKYKSATCVVAIQHAPQHVQPRRLPMWMRIGLA